MDPIVTKLRDLNLKTYPENIIRNLIGQLGKFGAVEMTLYPGKTIIRARPNGVGQHFTNRNELSYKPQKFNTSYQRASTPYLSMFYAGSIPEDLQPDELDNARIISTLEASNLLRDNDQEGEQTITFSKWEVTKDIPLIAICHHKDFTTKSSHTKELYDAYQTWVKDLPAELMEKSIEITTFLASEFAKKEIRGGFDYLISSIFFEITVSKGKAGIYYPSVRTDGMGFNVAIAPDIVDSSLKLVVAGECTIYKKGEHTIVDNETICTIHDDSIPFIMYPVAAENHIGREKVSQELNKPK